MDDARERNVGAGLARHREGLQAHLLEVGFAASGARVRGRLLCELDRWLGAQGVTAGELSEELIGRFAAARRSAGRSGPVTRRGLAPVIGYLRGIDAIPPAGGADDAVEDLVAAYERYLRVERRLAPLTVVNGVGVVRRFLSQREDKAELGSLDVAEVHQVVLGEAGRLSPGAARAFVGAFRPFLRFLFATGRLGRDLAAAVPGVAGSRLASLPKAAHPDAVRALLGSCDRRTPSGRRDFAVLVLLSRLGLRAIEVASMRLEDLDWRAGEVAVRGKGARIERLPLPADVGAAIADYLRHGRPPSTSRAVFLQVPPPRQPMSRNAVVFVSRSASTRAGIPTVGAHRLRHSAATAMLREGGSLREVGQVLRHHDDATTSIYAKVDRQALDLVVRPWPEATR
ncbi:MAG: tyrosine-type recombinase/integrase [Acidimicrobiales bacterium]